MKKNVYLRTIVSCPCCGRDQKVAFKNNAVDCLSPCCECGQVVVFQRRYTGPGYRLVKQQEVGSGATAEK